MSLEYKLECEALTEISNIFEGNMAPPDFYVYSDTGINGLLEAKGVRGFNSVQAIKLMISTMRVQRYWESHL